MRPGALEATAVAEEPRLAPELLASFAYDELLVLVHGLQGTAEDFTFFEQQLQQSAAASAGQLLIHVTDVNTERTHDGIVEGGMRLAEDIQRVVAENPSLNGISLVGFSLGGMYARYAAALLYDDATSTVAGLTPKTFATVASPNLGVRRFGVFRLIPQPLFGATKFLFGQTGDDLVMNGDTDEPLVVSMSKDRNPVGLPFLTALRSFSRRYLYGECEKTRYLESHPTFLYVGS
jgi:pimeloyl-ACP methyl ester carboxylesterase